jgi:hypothetical protein
MTRSPEYILRIIVTKPVDSAIGGKTKSNSNLIDSWRVLHGVTLPH